MASLATALLASVLVLAVPAAAQGVCRPNALGTIDCPVARPKLRPPYLPDTQGLDRVRRRAPPQDREPEFIPAWRTNRLGTTPLTGAESGGIRGVCRQDSFGNTICP